jgi:hypothetical protein
MAIDFRLTSYQRELRLESRVFAADVLANARAAELLPTPEERFRATKPVYEAMVSGRRRQRWPDRHGHHDRGVLQRRCERHLDDVGDCARSLANLVGRYVGAGQPIAEAILEEEWSAASRVLLHRMLPSATSPRPTRPKLCRERTKAQACAFKVACWPRLSIYDA